jgi:Ni/Fe-hydrogenase subunit HybB-like protein
MNLAVAGRQAVRRLGFWPAVCGLILVLFAAVTVLRFTRGLGAVTNLSDQFPWGLWVGFDVLCGVGLAAGGFTMAAAVYIFGLKRMHSIVRPSILTAYLGYTLVSVGLIIDLGKPWNIWHPLVMWNPHSVMFEVAWCVMLYSTVLTLEFSPVLFEKLGWQRPLKIVKKLTLPLVIAGVLLSIMHQSSLGSVFLIVPGKLHALWYSSALPIFFFVSAVSVGLSMVIFESYLSARILGHRLKSEVLQKLGLASVGVLRSCSSCASSTSCTAGCSRSSSPARRKASSAWPRSASASRCRSDSSSPTASAGAARACSSPRRSWCWASS